MVKQPEIRIDFNELNHSELVELCRWAEIPASRAVPRDLLIEALENFEPFELTDPVEIYRERMSSWLSHYWDRVKMQAAKKVCPDCSLCRDLQVLECYNKNRKYFDPKGGRSR